MLPGMAGATWFRLAVGADCGNGANLPALGDASMFVAGQIFPVLQVAPCESSCKVDSASLVRSPHTEKRNDVVKNALRGAPGHSSK